MEDNDLKQQFGEQRALVIGDVMLDAYLRGEVRRISPEAPVPVVNYLGTDRRLGGAANVALNLQALGAEVALLGVVGDDDAGKELSRKLNDNTGTYPILDYTVVSDQRLTTVKTRVLSGNQQLLRIDIEEAHPLNDAEFAAFSTRFSEVLDDLQPTVILLQDYNKGVLSPRSIELVLETAQQASIPVTVDPKFTNFYAYQGVQLFKPNAKEVANAVGEFSTELHHLERITEQLRRKLGAKQLLITLGGKGIYYQDGVEQGVVPTTPRQIVDVCGAGDAVFAIASLGTAIGLSLLDIAKLGNLGGGQVCEQVGVVPMNAAQLLREWRALSNH